MPATIDAIPMSFTGHDRKVITKVVEAGIDARLEGFLYSTFSDDGHRLSCEIAPDEMQILLRRLSEYVEGDDEAELLLEDIVYACFRDEE